MFPLSISISNPLLADSNVCSNIVIPLAARTVRVDLSDEDVIAAWYAILFAPSYLSRFRDQLRLNYPRIPQPRTAKLFSTLSEIDRALETHGGWPDAFGTDSLGQRSTQAPSAECGKAGSTVRILRPIYSL